MKFSCEIFRVHRHKITDYLKFTFSLIGNIGNFTYQK